MQIELAVAASPTEAAQFIEKLESRGFSFEPGEPDATSVKMFKCYEDATTGEFKARVNVMAYGFSNGQFYEYSAYVETAGHDSVTGETCAGGNTFGWVTQQNDSFTNNIYFLDSVLQMGACVGCPPVLLSGD